MSEWNAFRPYAQGDLPHIWQTLRDEDLREYRAVGITDPHLIEAFIKNSSHRVQTWDSDIGPLVVLGVTPGDDPLVGHIWAVASSRASPRWRFAVRETNRILDELSEGYRLLYNVKDSRNTEQIAWLRKLGFTFFNSIPDYSGSGVTFHEFARIPK